MKQAVPPKEKYLPFVWKLRISNLAVMLPRDNAYQVIENVAVQWPGEFEIEDQGEIEVVKLVAKSAAEGVVEAVLAYDVILRQGKVAWDGEIEQQDLLPQHDIESDEAVLVHKAQEICTDGTEYVAFETYQFTAGYLTWPEGSREGEES